MGHPSDRDEWILRDAVEWIQGTAFYGILLLGVTLCVVGGVVVVTRSNLPAGHLEGQAPAGQWFLEWVSPEVVVRFYLVIEFVSNLCP